MFLNTLQNYYINTPCPEKRGHVIFNYDSRIPWSIFIIFIPLETGMNTPQLHVIYLIAWFNIWLQHGFDTFTIPSNQLCHSEELHNKLLWNNVKMINFLHLNYCTWNATNNSYLSHSQWAAIIQHNDAYTLLNLQQILFVLSIDRNQMIAHLSPESAKTYP